LMVTAGTPKAVVDRLAAAAQTAMQSPEVLEKLFTVGVEVDYRHVAEYYKGAPGNYTAFIYTDDLTSKQLVSYRDWLEADVRHTLSIPFNSANPGLRYEHSMGQSGLPPSILRTSDATTTRATHKSLRVLSSGG